jgi:hypothetical protein
LLIGGKARPALTLPGYFRVRTCSDLMPFCCQITLASSLEGLILEFGGYRGISRLLKLAWRLQPFKRPAKLRDFKIK